MCPRSLRGSYCSDRLCLVASSDLERIFETLGQHPRFLRLPFLARLPGSIGAVAARMEQDLAFDGGEFWRLAGIAPRRFLAGGSSDLGLA